MSKTPKLCSQQECERPTHAKGLCNFHYVEYRKAVVPECATEDCKRPSRSRGLCSTHYDQVLRAEEQEEIDYDDFWEFVKKQLKIGEPNDRARQNQLS
jgi:hypothetical protein